MYKFGMPTLIELDSIEDHAQLCNTLGLSFIELNLNLPQYQPCNIDLPHFLAVAEQYDIAYTLHLDERASFCEFNPKVARAWTETMLDVIAMAKALRAPLINMHLDYGVYFTLPERREYLFNRYFDSYSTSLCQFRDACAACIADSGICICIENTDGYQERFQLESLRTLLSHDAFCLTYDVGHDHAIGHADEPLILRYKTKLRHMHLHDAVGKQNHMPLGLGEIPLMRYLDLALSCQSSVLIEVKTKTGLIRSVEWMTKALSAMRS